MLSKQVNPEIKGRALERIVTEIKKAREGVDVVGTILDNERSFVVLFGAGERAQELTRGDIAVAARERTPSPIVAFELSFRKSFGCEQVTMTISPFVWEKETQSLKKSLREQREGGGFNGAIGARWILDVFDSVKERRSKQAEHDVKIGEACDAVFAHLGRFAGPDGTPFEIRCEDGSAREVYFLLAQAAPDVIRTRDTVEARVKWRREASPVVGLEIRLSNVEPFAAARILDALVREGYVTRAPVELPDLRKEA